MFKKDFLVIIDHDLSALEQVLKRLHRYKVRIYDLYDKTTSIILRCETSKRLLKKIYKDEAMSDCIFF